MKILWVGDSPDCPSGFGLATRKILETLAVNNDVTVLGINYRGDPHPSISYPIYVAAVGGDYLGVGRITWMCEQVEPDVIVLQNDGWHIAAYLYQLAISRHRDIPVVGIIAVDGKNFQSEWLNVRKKTGEVAKTLDAVITWTQFALDEIRASGWDGPGSVIPLGVDLEVYRPIDRYEARSRRLPREMDDAFVVGNVNRNQPRKRLDLCVKYFAEWVYKGLRQELRSGENFAIKDAWLYLHVAPTGDTGIDVKQLAKYYGVLSRLCLYEPPVWYGLSESEMRDTYNCFDVAVTTTQGEGFGLTTLEAMACGVPVIVPEWSALGEWCKDAAWMVKCSSTAIGLPYVNVLGGVADKELFVHGLQALYANKLYRETNSVAGLERASENRFRWEVIGQRYVEVLDALLHRHEWSETTTMSSVMRTFLCSCGQMREEQLINEGVFYPEQHYTDGDGVAVNDKAGV